MPAVAARRKTLCDHLMQLLSCVIFKVRKVSLLTDLVQTGFHSFFTVLKTSESSIAIWQDSEGHRFGAAGVLRWLESSQRRPAEWSGVADLHSGFRSGRIGLWKDSCRTSTRTGWKLGTSKQRVSITSMVHSIMRSMFPQRSAGSSRSPNTSYTRR